MSTDSTIASDIGQRATESNNHPERLGKYHDEEVGQKGEDRGDDSTTTTNDDDDDDDDRGDDSTTTTNEDDDDDKITINYTVDY
jgi:hypothetical protein